MAIPQTMWNGRPGNPWLRGGAAIPAMVNDGPGQGGALSPKQQRAAKAAPTGRFSVGVPGTPTYREFGAAPNSIGGAIGGTIAGIFGGRPAAGGGNAAISNQGPTVGLPAARPPKPQGGLSPLENAMLSYFQSTAATQGQSQTPVRPSNNKPYGPNWLGAGQVAAGMQQSAQNFAMQDAVAGANRSRVSGPLTGTYSMPVAAGSAHGAGNSPSQAAAAGAYMARQADLHFNKDSTLGGQQALSDYVTDPATGQRRLGDPNNPADRAQMLGAGGGVGNGTGSGSGETNTQQMVRDLFDQYGNKLDEANAANQARYDQGLGELTALRDRRQADIDRSGGQRAADIRREAKNAKAESMQNAVSRGLVNTSVPAANSRAITRESNAELNRLGDVLARQRIDADNMLTGNITDWIYKRDDNAPDFGQMIELAKLYGQSGAGQGGLPFSLEDILSQLPGIGNFGGGDGGGTPFLLPQMFGQGGGGNGNGQRVPGVNQPGGVYTRPISKGGARDITGGLGLAGMAYGLGQYNPQIIDGLMQLYRNGGLGGVGNSLGNAATGGASYLSGLIGDGSNWLANLYRNAQRQVA